MTAEARTSGDRLPIDVTLHTPDGQLLLAHTVLTVHSTSISFVGIALTALAARCSWCGGCGPGAGTRGAACGPSRRRSEDGPPAPSRTLPLRTSAVYVAFGTGVSRVTGLLRFVALAWALGPTLLADGYNLANTTPNMLYDVVLGGVLSATFIPVFVDRLANRAEDEAYESISAVLTVSLVVLGVTTVAALVAAPYLIDALTALDTHAHSGQLQPVLQERHVATVFLRWFVIQIAAYGVFALGAALLNTRRRFVAVAWAPILNNLVCIGILIWFGLWAGRGASLSSIEQHQTQLVLLGLGTSLGVVVQGIALVPSLLQSHWGRLRWRWNLHDEALRAVARLGGWTFGFVVANQIALFVVTVLAGSVPGPDPVSSYTYAYAFFQLPYGIVAVTVMSVVTPDLAEKWSTGQTPAFLHRMTGGLRAVLALIIPSAVGMLLLAKPALALLLGHGPQHARPDGDRGCRPGHVRPGSPGLLHLPLHGARPPVDAADQGRVLPLPARERPQRGPGPGPGPPARRAGPRPVPLDRLHGGGRGGMGHLPAVVRPAGRTGILGPPAPRRRGVRPHGPRGPDRLEPLGLDQDQRPVRPGGLRRAGRRRHLRGRHRVAGTAQRRTPAAGPPRRTPADRWAPPPRPSTSREAARGRLPGCPGSTSSPTAPVT